MWNQIIKVQVGKRQAEMADKLLQFCRENWLVIGGLFTVLSGICGGIWGFYQWKSNRAIPFNISISLASAIDAKAKDASVASSEAKPALPITIQVNVENKSGWRELAIRDPAWVAYGFRLAAPVQSMGERVNSIKITDLLARINRGFTPGINTMEAIGDRRLLDHSYIKEPIGAGQLLGDREIKPGETLHSQLILPVTRGSYDFAQIRVYIPTLNQPPNQQYERIDDIKVPLKLQGKEYGYEARVIFCRVPDHVCMPLKKEELKALGAQIHSSVSEIWLGNSAGP